MTASAALTLLVAACAASPVMSSKSGPRVIRAGPGPDALAITPDGQTLYVANGGEAGRGDTVTPDGRTLYIAGSSDITPVDVATGAPGKALYVANQGNDTVAVIPLTPYCHS